MKQKSLLTTIFYFFKKVILNKYVLVLIAYFVFITFFDQHSLLSRWDTRQKINELKIEKKYFENEIKANKLLLKKLKTDKVYLEKFAREKYLMKAKGEEIFIIKEE